MTSEELRIIRGAMDRLALCAEDEDDATLVESVIDRVEAAEARLTEARELLSRQGAELASVREAVEQKRDILRLRAERAERQAAVMYGAATRLIARWDSAGLGRGDERLVEDIRAALAAYREGR